MQFLLVAFPLHWKVNNFSFLLYSSFIKLKWREREISKILQTLPDMSCRQTDSLSFSHTLIDSIVRNNWINLKFKFLNLGQFVIFFNFYSKHLFNNSISTRGLVFLLFYRSFFFCSLYIQNSKYWLTRSLKFLNKTKSLSFKSLVRFTSKNIPLTTKYFECPF